MTRSSSSSSSRPFVNRRSNRGVGRTLAGWAALGAALFVLNLALTFHNVWPTPWITTRHELSVELGILLLALAGVSGFRGQPGRSLLAGLSLLYLVLTLGRYLEVTVPALFGRSLNLYWDARHLPAVGAMLAEAAGVWAFAGVVSGLALLLVGLYLLLRWAWGRVGRALADPEQRLVLIALGAGLCALFVGGRLSAALDTERWFSLPVTQTYARQAHFLVQALAPQRGADALPAGPDWPSDLSGLRGADVMVVSVESYGAVTFDRLEYAAVVGPGRDALARAAGETGRGAVSAFVESPTFGGVSWLAHASLLSGIEIRDRRDYDLLLTTDRPTLVGHLERKGYRTLALMPGLRQAWPEGSFYGFDRIYDRAAIDYRGPEFGWWGVPDQFALARLDALELGEGDRSPVLLFFPTISSHAPFRPVPPYEPDWKALLAGRAYAPEAVEAALSIKPDWTDLGSAYVDAMAYVLMVLAGYLAGPAPEDLVLVVLGDHQPPASVSGPQAGWEVPVHVISARGPLLERLVAAGFTPGMRPRRPVLAPMHELGAILLSAVGATEVRDPPAPGQAPGDSAGDEPRIDVSGGGLAR